MVLAAVDVLNAELARGVRVAGGAVVDPDGFGDRGILAADHADSCIVVEACELDRNRGPTQRAVSEANGICEGIGEELTSMQSRELCLERGGQSARVITHLPVG